MGEDSDEAEGGEMTDDGVTGEPTIAGSQDNEESKTTAGANDKDETDENEEDDDDNDGLDELVNIYFLI